MRIAKGVFAVVLVLSLFSGCAQTDQPENQAIAISLGIDAGEGETLQLSLLLPSLHGAGQGTNSGTYTICSATAHSFAEAIGILRASIPFTLNLAQLKTVIISQEVAQSERLPDLVSDMFLTHRLYNAAFCIISVGKAKDMLEEMNNASFGTRLSSMVLTALENFIEEGGIPETHFSDFYYDMNSIYGSPIAILGAASDGKHTTLTPEGRAGDALPGALPREGGNKNEYSGTALFREGRMVGTLSSLETAWMNYLRGETRNIAYNCDGTNVVLSPAKKAGVRTEAGEQLRVQIDAVFTVSSQCSLDILTSMIRADLAAVIRKCQSLGVDPFLFSQRAASSFMDIPSWIDYEYYGKYADAEIDINVRAYMITD